MSRKLTLVLVLLLVLGSLASAVYSASKFSLAYWREAGSWEANMDGCTQSITVWVFDEMGRPVPGIGIYVWGGVVNYTNADGKCYIAMQSGWDNLIVHCVDPNDTTVTSDNSPLMTPNRFTCGWTTVGNYELGFVYKTDTTNPGTFQANASDASTFNCTVNTSGSSDTDAPYTKSLAYNAINCSNRDSDTFSASTAGTSFGQTFVANGDRVVGVELDASAVATTPPTPLSWSCQILQGGPTGTPVSVVKSTPSTIANGRYYIPFAVNECPVVNGQTYFVKFWSSNSFTVNKTNADVYSGGQFYIGTTAVPGSDIVGLVCCETYGTNNLGIISGTITDSSTNNPIPDVQVTLVPSNLKATTNSSGAFSFSNMPGATSYTLTAIEPGYCDYTQNVVSITNQTVTVPIKMTAGNTNLVLNPGFESGITNWTTSGSFQTFANGAFGVPSHGGSNFGGCITSYGQGDGLAYQTISGLQVGKDYVGSAFVRTDSWAFDNTSKMYTYYPTNIYCSLYLDPSPFSDGSPNIGSVWFHPAYSFEKWAFVQWPVTTTGAKVDICLKTHVNYMIQWSFANFDDISFVQVCKPAPTYTGISTAMGNADGISVTLPAKLVTAGFPTFSGAFYIEDTDRSEGIRVVASTTQYQGDLVDITGTMGSDATTGERLINATNVTLESDSNTIPEALFTTGKCLGGVSLNSHTAGVYKGYGLYNVGKLVTVCGKVTYRGTNFFYIDDGSGLYDGNGVTTATGVRINTTGMSNPTQNYVFIENGIATMTKIGANSVRTVCPLTQGDIVGY